VLSCTAVGASEWERPLPLLSRAAAAPEQDAEADAEAESDADEEKEAHALPPQFPARAPLAADLRGQAQSPTWRN
jgi:hypothetical protein